MYEIHLLNLQSNKEFTKIFWNKKEVDTFVNKCKYSKKVKIISIQDNSKLYD